MWQPLHMRTSLALAALAAALAAAAASAHARPDIFLGSGAYRVELGATRALVVRWLDKPLREGYGVLEYRGLSFHLRGGRVVLIEVFRRDSCTAGGTCVGRAGGVKRLREELGSRLEPYAAEDGERGYVVRSSKLGRPVFTAFATRGTVVTRVRIGYCAGTEWCP